MHTERIEIRVAGELQPLIPRFLANRAAELRQLEEALQEQDSETMRRIGHVLKGAGGSYGFADISRIGAVIEEAARSREFGRLGEQIAALKHYLECVHVVFE